jgi:Mg/Co/Ni transporter MgtE
MFVALATSKAVARQALKVSLVVGTVLALINYWDAPALTANEWIKIGLTYLVPYCVSTYSSVRAIQHHRSP